MSNIYEELLVSYADALERFQIKSDDPLLNGGAFCPFCRRLHGRFPDAVFPFVVAYKKQKISAI